MMCLLHWVLAPPSSPLLATFPSAWGTLPGPLPGFRDALFSVLYSDIGPKFYALAGPAPNTPGWIVQNPLSTAWELTEDYKPITTPIWLSEQSVYGFLEKESDRLKGEVPSNSYTFLPKDGLYEFLIKRSVTYRSPDKPEWPSSVWGVAVGDAFAVWSFDTTIAKSALVIAYFRATEKTFPELLAHIKAFARKFDGVQVVEAWDVHEEFRVGGVTEERDEHLPAVMWYGDQADGAKYRWFRNEK